MRRSLRRTVGTVVERLDGWRFGQNFPEHIRIRVGHVAERGRQLTSRRHEAKIGGAHVPKLIRHPEVSGQLTAHSTVERAGIVLLHGYVGKFAYRTIDVGDCGGEREPWMPGQLDTMVPAQLGDLAEEVIDWLICARAAHEHGRYHTADTRTRGSVSPLPTVAAQSCCAPQLLTMARCSLGAR